MLKSKTQIMYDLTFEAMQKICEKTYQYLPMIDVGYPFAVINDSETRGDVSKDMLFQIIEITVDIWGNDSQRKLIDDYSNQLLESMVDRGLIKKESGYRINVDHSTDEILYRSQVTLAFEWR